MPLSVKHMTLPDLAEKRCTDLTVTADLAVQADVLASIGSVRTSPKPARRVIGDIGYGISPGRVHLLAVIRERPDRPALLTMWVHIDPRGTPGRPRLSREARAAEKFGLALDRLGEAIVGKTFINIRATFRFPLIEYSLAPFR